MLPVDLKTDHFNNYPAQAMRLAVTHLSVFQQMPISFLPSLLRELIEYDYKFPAERSSIERELLMLSAMSSREMLEFFRAFSRIHVPSSYDVLDWVGHPAEFTDQFSAYLWSTHQMDAFRAAATTYGDRLRVGKPSEVLPLRRLGIAVIGRGVSSYEALLFRKLREHGTYFGRVNPEKGFDSLFAAVIDRAKTHPVPYGHWYVDGGELDKVHASINGISYEDLGPVRNALLKKIQGEVEKPGMGPEELHARMARLLPSDLGMDGDTLLNRFQVKVLTEGSGTQIFSTTFVQWTAREVLRRAEALTLLVRYSPRQRERPMSELLSSNLSLTQLDPLGSLIDADMGSYYQWINQQRLSGSQQSSFLAWFEGHHQAIAIGPTLPRGAESTSQVDLKSLLALATS